MTWLPAGRPWPCISGLKLNMPVAAFRRGALVPTASYCGSSLVGVVYLAGPASNAVAPAAFRSLAKTLTLEMVPNWLTDRMSFTATGAPPEPPALTHTGTGGCATRRREAQQSQQALQERSWS